MPVIEIIDEAMWEKEHEKNKTKLMMVDFYATWCGPCKAVAPRVEELSNKYKNECAFYKVDVDKNREIAQKAKVEAMPTFIFYANRSQLNTVKGADPAKIEKLIQELHPKYTKNVFASQGYSLSASTQSNNTNKPSNNANNTQGNQPARKNPWADPNFFPGGAKSQASDPKTTTSSTATAQPNNTSSSNNVASTSANPPSQAPSTTNNPHPKPNTPWADPNFKPNQGGSSSVAAPGITPDPVLLQNLIEMGFSLNQSSRALVATKNKGAETAMDWILANQDNPDLDKPLPATATVSNPTTDTTNSSSTPANDNATKDVEMKNNPLDSKSKEKESNLMSLEDDEDASVLLAEIRRQKAGSALAPTEPPKSEEEKLAIRQAAEEREQTRFASLSPAEKEKWLAQKKLEVKAKREKEALELAKQQEKSRQTINKAAGELKERMEQEQIKAMVEAKKKAAKDSAAHRNEIRDKIAADKLRRQKEHEAELERIRKLKEEQEKAKAKK